VEEFFASQDPDDQYICITGVNADERADDVKFLSEPDSTCSFVVSGMTLR
jgi:hypothetical protein